ncbi:MAG: lytic transglycosylase domain-containing protein [Clostridia bacterium]|nr:lytic transglycosylase domain-containing protein [Clostridia bacterium]
MKKVIKTIIVIISAFVLVAPILFYGKIYKNYNSVKGYIFASCEKYEVSKNLVISVAYVESKFDSKVVSKKGATGVMQIMPSTFNFVVEKYAIVGLNDICNAKTNIEVGVVYLKYLLIKYNSEVIALASYNAGEGNVCKWLENGELKVEKIPFKETYNYVKRVMKIKTYLDRKVANS